jgi:hypothetical protein
MHNKKLQNVYCSPNISGIINKDEMGKTYSTNGRNERCIQNQKTPIRDQLANLGIKIQIIFKCTLEK